ncbi:MAG: hypothetical protein WDZ49_14830 [Litorilinea sp.]
MFLATMHLALLHRDAAARPEQLAEHQTQQTTQVDGISTMTGRDTSGAELGQPARKISAEFAARLQRLAPDAQIRVIVLATRSNASEREAAAAAEAHAAGPLSATLAQIDACLATGEGQRLTERPNFLGYVVVETNRRGIDALANLACVDAIMEDQPIHPHLPVNRSE